MSEPTPAADRRRQRLGWAFRALLSLAILIWVWHKFQLREHLHEVPPSAFAALLGVTVLYAGLQFINTWKWWLLLRATGHPVGFWPLIRITFIGMYANWFLPTSVGGDVLRIALVMRTGVPGTPATLTVFLQRFTGFLALLAIGLTGVFAAAAVGGTGAGRVLALAALISAVGLVVMIVGAVMEERWRLGERLPAAVGRPVRKLGEGLRQLAASPRDLALIMLASVLFQFGLTVVEALLGIAVGVAPAPVHWLWIVPMMSLAEMIPFSLGGVGIREGAAGAAFAPLGFKAMAIIWSVLWQATKVLASLPGGLLMLGKDPLAAGEAPAEEPTAA